MHHVVVDRDAIQVIVERNRENHRAMYRRAVEGFHKAVVEELEKALADARAGKDYRLSLNLPIPSDHTEDYDRVIGMLSHSVHQEIDLTAQEYENYVRDRWGWSAGFTQTSSRYL